MSKRTATTYAPRADAHASVNSVGREANEANDNEYVRVRERGTAIAPSGRWCSPHPRQQRRGSTPKAAIETTDAASGAAGSARVSAASATLCASERASLHLPADP